MMMSRSKKKKQKESQQVKDNLGLVVTQALKYDQTSIHSTDDHIQIGSIALLKCLRRYNPKKAAISSYVCPSIHNEIRRALMKENKKPATTCIDLAYSVIGDEGAIQTDKLWELIPDTLTEQERKVVELRMQGLTFKKIGQEMNFARTWAGVLFRRAMRKIKKAYGR